MVSVIRPISPIVGSLGSNGSSSSTPSTIRKLASAVGVEPDELVKAS